MKKADVFIVRFLPFLLFLQVGVTIILANKGIGDYPFNLLHSNSAIYALALFLISLSNRKYHCSWNRAMYAFLIIIPVFNFLDGLLNLIPEVEIYLLVVHIAYALTAIVTAYLAIRHFVKTIINRYYARTK